MTFTKNFSSAACPVLSGARVLESPCRTLWMWGRSIAFIRRLEKESAPLHRLHFPCIVETRPFEIEMEWMGHTIGSKETFHVPMNEIWWQLKTVLMVLVDAQIRHRDITHNNLLWHPEHGLGLIDYGWSIWYWEQDTPIPVPEVMRPWMCDLTDYEQAERTIEIVEKLRRGEHASY